ncbi:hypothetical protein RESH_01513 [Rhodopirellula europaea SH398]|uniref:Uncharacterized protein n=1 Tax=Rhodopirellula europaea SH398 TaxID=1263868 RepID=M5SJP1_9BACT|nr:hypothetical protein RESH_01513 [Rhodopirellula europaea SH398]
MAGGRFGIGCHDLRQYAEICLRWQAGQIDFHLLSFRAWRRDRCRDFLASNLDSRCDRSHWFLDVL